jgi:hypothetical protein
MALNNNKPVIKSLTFAPKVRVRKIKHIDEFTDEEVSACFYQKEEMHRVKLELKVTLQMLQLGELEKDTPHFTKRGTEKRTPDAVKRRSINKQMASAAVFEEQGDQWEDGLTNSEMLASIYQAASSHCQVAAHNIALEYENEVNELSWSHLDCDFSDCVPKEYSNICTPLKPKQVVHRRVSNVHRRVSNAAA